MIDAAVRENAEWCDAFCRAHGLRGQFGDTAWTCATRTPPLYPDAVTLTPDASEEEVLARIDTTSPGASVKDSFARLDLAPAGFEVLFEARWIMRPGGRPGPLRWKAVRTPDALRDWDAAFPAGLLTDPTVHVLAGRRDGRITAGAVAHRSADVVGLSNVFTRDGEPPWSTAVETVARLAPGVPLVGYDHGPDLATALDDGWTHP